MLDFMDSRMSKREGMATTTSAQRRTERERVSEKTILMRDSNRGRERETEKNIPSEQKERIHLLARLFGICLVSFPIL
jgi:hypothetical protein